MTAAQIAPGGVNGSFDAGNIIPGGGAAGDIDTAAFTGNLSQYILTRGPNGTVIVTDTAAGRDGTDTLHNVERLQFADRTISATNAAPTGMPAISGTTPTGDFGGELQRQRDHCGIGGRIR